MKVVYASRSGHVEGIVRRAGVTDALKIEDGNERVDGDYLIFTYTDGKGIVPAVVERFLEQNPGVKGVVGSGSRERHADTFNFAADKIAERPLRAGGIGSRSPVPPSCFAVCALGP